MALICNAVSKSTGEQCKQPVVTGSTKCRYHGGSSLKGIASPTIKTGRYSKYLPARMQERYTEALTDSELINLREEIALLDSRLADLLSRVDRGEAGAAWKAVKAAFNKLSVAMDTADGKKLIEARSELFDVVHKGYSEFMAWSEITTLIDQRRRLVESERKRLIEMEQMLTLEQATLFYRALLDSIKRNVSDRHVLSAIQTDFISLTARTDSQRVSVESDDGG